MEKKEWRRKMKQRLRRMSKAEFYKSSQRIYAQLFLEDVWKKAETIGITLALSDEIDTEPIIRRAWDLQKRVAVPKSNPLVHELTFYEIDSFAQLEKGYAKIMEPIPSMTKKVPKDRIDLLFVPGLVFDKEGYRIGYGGGYYDRYLQQFANETLSLAFEYQIVESLPHEPFDQPIDRIISENRVLTVSSSRRLDHRRDEG